MRLIDRAGWLLPITTFAILLSPVVCLAQFNFGLNMGGMPSHFELSDSVYLDEADSATKTHLERVRAFVANEQWDEAVETLRQVMENHGDKVVATPLQPYMLDYLKPSIPPIAPAPPYELKHYLNLRDYCQVQLAGMPAAGLALYRDRVDPQAKKLFDEAAANRDADRLAEVVDQFFASTWGDNACYLLGELALEQGDFRQARESWQRILPPDYWQRTAVKRHDLRPPWLSYPDSDIAPADVLARLALAAILEGSPEVARKDLAELQASFADATGNLGGRNANYVQLLSGLLESATSWPLPKGSDDWLTFAGSPQRNLLQRGKLDIGVVKWLQPLPKTPAADVSISMTHAGEERQSPLSYFPLVVGNLLLLNTQTEILAFDVKTGKPVWGPDPVIFRDETLGVDRGSMRNALGTPRFTMTAFGSRLYVRLGNPVTSSQSEQPLPMDKGCLACIDLVRQGSLVWRIEPPDEKWAFEGSPLCDGDNVYVGMRRSDVRPQAHVACFDAHNGKLKWRRMVSSAETIGQGQSNEITSNLLTLDGRRLYYNTNLGAVAALDTRRGQIQWLTIYPRVKSGDLSDKATHFYRDLTPCLYHCGKLFVAPADAEELWAIDAGTGLLFWKRLPRGEPADSPTQLLGVAEGMLWASGRSLWAIDVISGKLRTYFPESPNDGLKSCGRGVLVGDKVYWPTADRIHIFDQRTGQQARQPIELSARGAPVQDEADLATLPKKASIELSTQSAKIQEPLHGGNLLVAGGYLFVVSSDKLFALDQQSGLRLNANKPERKP